MKVAKRLIRAPLGIVPKEVAVPVIRGQLRGARWIVGSHTHGCWLGTYEADKQRLLADLVHQGMTFYDIGAHAGYYTLLVSHLVGPSGRVIALEPLPRNLTYLRRHLHLNRVTNVQVIDAAVSDREGETRFRIHPSHAMGHIPLGFNWPEESITVRTVTLDGLIARGAPTPNIVKIDVEGAEDRALIGAQELLKSQQPLVLVAFHFAEKQAVAERILIESGYTLTALDAQGHEWLAKPSRRDHTTSI